MDNLEILQLLIQKGANVNLIDNLNWTPINRAIDLNKKEIVKILIENGANLIGHQFKKLFLKTIWKYLNF